MATIAVVTPGLTPTDVGFTAANSGGDKILNDGKVLIILKSNGAPTKTVTISPSSNQPHPGAEYTDLSTTLTSGQGYIIGPLNPAIWNDASGYVQLTYDSATNLFVAAVRLRS